MKVGELRNLLAFPTILFRISSFCLRFLNLISILSLFSSSCIAAMELKKLPAKKKLLSQLKQQNAIQNQLPPSSISVIPLSSQQAHTTATKMDQDDDEIAAHDDDSPLDMRITKQQDSDELRPSVIRKKISRSFFSNNFSEKDKEIISRFLKLHIRVV